ncbi:MAG: DUF3108 domain-containing protein [Proteobacteria bacterium]|nr:DUF3108 domain-containing protein [Pseudomonadota bacterium]
MILLRMTVLTIIVGLWSSPASAANAIAAVDHKNLYNGIIDPALLVTGYSGKENLVYDVSWTGGIKIGELHLQVNSLPDTKDEYEIRATVTTKNAAIDLIYPIRDLHVTRVRGPKRLPYHYEIWQKEGYKYRAHRVIEYNQETGAITYTKNNKLEGLFQVDGETNNEFSSFFNSRLMDFPIGGGFIVPTFADKKRVEVVVNAIATRYFDETLLGPVTTVEIMPVMTFKGLYDKKGDTVIWYTNDECRVPVMINSKILIGSLTAELTAYENPACTRYPSVALKKK